MMREAEKKKAPVVKDENADLSSFIQERSMMIDEGLRGQKEMSYDSIKYDAQQSEIAAEPEPLPNADDTKLDFSELQSEAPKMTQVMDDYGIEEPSNKDITGSPSRESVARSKKSVRFSEDCEEEPLRVKDEEPAMIETAEQKP